MANAFDGSLISERYCTQPLVCCLAACANLMFADSSWPVKEHHVPERHKNSFYCKRGKLNFPPTDQFCYRMEKGRPSYKKIY